MIISVNMYKLEKRIRKKQTFKLQLPGNLRIYRPAYDAHLYLEKDIVIFRASQVDTSYFFIGEIQRTGIGGGTGVRWYDVICILRPANRDVAYKINWLTKARITRSSILCELTPERK